MSATKFTASVTVANSSGRIVRNRKIGTVGVAPDDVPKEPEGVVVGPLDVVDEQRDRPDLREQRDRDARKVEGSQELRIGRHVLEAGLVAS